MRPKWSRLVTSRVTAVTSCDILIPQVTVEDLVIYPGDLYFNQLVYSSVATIELCSFYLLGARTFCDSDYTNTGHSICMFTEDASVSSQMYNVS